MERSIACLALELPAEVWEDVRDKWHAALDHLRADADLFRYQRDVEIERYNRETTVQA